MPGPGPVVERVRVQVATSPGAGYTVCHISDPSKGDYRFVVAAKHLRAIVAALQSEIDAHPDVFPLTETRRAPLTPAFKRL